MTIKLKNPLNTRTGHKKDALKLTRIFQSAVLNDYHTKGSTGKVVLGRLEEMKRMSLNISLEEKNIKQDSNFSEMLNEHLSNKEVILSFVSLELPGEHSFYLGEPLSNLQNHVRAMKYRRAMNLGSIARIKQNNPNVLMSSLFEQDVSDGITLAGALEVSLEEKMRGRIFLVSEMFVDALHKGKVDNLSENTMGAIFAAPASPGNRMGGESPSGESNIQGYTVPTGIPVQTKSFDVRSVSEKEEEKNKKSGRKKSSKPSK